MTRQTRIGRSRIGGRSLATGTLLAAAFVAASVLAALQAQTAPGSSAPTTPSPAAPITPPPATLTQPVPTAPSPAPGSTPPASPSTPPVPVGPPLTTLLPQAGDPGDVDEVVLTAKPVAILSGQASWDDGLKAVRATLTRMRGALDRAGIKVVGRPLAIFTETSDDTFKYEAEWPIEFAAGAPPPAAPEGSGIRFGTTPAGKAYRFVHKGPYDEIDSTYETITAYLDAKDIVAKDAFVEEYLSDTADAADAATEVNIFVQPK